MVEVKRNMEKNVDKLLLQCRHLNNVCQPYVWRLQLSEHQLKTLYLPGPIVRDIENCTIHYYNMLGDRMIYQDCVTLDKNPINPTCTIKIGEAQVKVFRPIDVKELYLDGKVHCYCNKGESVCMPYILKHRMRIADFSQKGYKTYECNQLASIYSLIGPNDNSTLICWEQGKEWLATELDSQAPDQLKVSIGNKNDIGKPEATFFSWNIYKYDAPFETTYDVIEHVAKGDIIFQDMKTPSEQLLNGCSGSSHLKFYTKCTSHNLLIMC